ncbi:hypothetical protein [Pseudomonas sp. efr-133-TYG-5]|jgi:hypothetical protein|nr:hypothetical protein [Pseudomonas sp. efr-133-TYG-5]
MAMRYSRAEIFPEKFHRAVFSALSRVFYSHFNGHFDRPIYQDGIS